MSGNICATTTTSSVALAASTPKTVLQVQAPTNQCVKVLGWGIYFDGVTASAVPVGVRLVRQTSAGTMSTGVANSLNNRPETILTTSRYGASAEPSNAGSSAEVDRITCNPQQWYESRFPEGQEIVIPGGGYLGIECTAAAIVNARAKLIFEE